MCALCVCGVFQTQHPVEYKVVSCCEQMCVCAHESMYAGMKGTVLYTPRPLCVCVVVVCVYVHFELFQQFIWQLIGVCICLSNHFFF